MVLDPSAYIAGLNRAAQHTANFQSSIQAGTAGVNAFGKASQSMAVGMSRLNGSVYASMTAFYALSRVVSSSLGVFEEYNNIISRISATADLSIGSVTALSESFKKLNRELGGSRTDLMKGVYRAVQANFTSPGEFMPIGAAAMRLRTASGREINTTKSADVISVIRNSLGIKSGREGFITDMLLRGRDMGRYELTEMASALGIPITLFGNQFAGKLGPEETLRQLIAILSSATQTGLNPRTAATGTRRMVEKTTRLMKSPEGIGKNLTTALRSMGFGSISEALNQGPMAFLETISRLTGGSPEALTQMGYGSRDIMLLTSALRNNMGQTREFYGKLAPGEIGGTTDKYLDKHKQTWWYQRDRLRSAYEDSQLKLMEAMIPVLTTFANSLEVVNDLFQALAPSIKRLIGLMTIGAGFSILRNFYVRGTGGKFGAQGSDNLMKNLPVMGAGTPRTADYYQNLRKVNVQNKYVPPVKSPIGNQIYGLNPWRSNLRSYYGGGLSPVGGRSPNGIGINDTSVTVTPFINKKYEEALLNRKYNSAFMRMGIREGHLRPKYINRTNITSIPFSVKDKRYYDERMALWGPQREALIAQNRAHSSSLRNAYGPNRVLGQATREMQEQWMWGNQRRADGRPMYTRGPDKRYSLPPMQSSMGMNKDWSSGRSFVGQAIREGYPRMRDNFYDSASRFFGRASDNMQGFGEGYGKAKGWLKDSWVGKKAAFAFGGNEYRLNSIQKGYDERIEMANKKLAYGKEIAGRAGLYMNNTLTQGGINPVAASRIAAQHFNSTMDQVTKNFNKATASAATTAKWMSRLSGVMGTIGSVANMAAIGGIFALISAFIQGLKDEGLPKMVDGKIDMSNAGQKGMRYNPLNLFKRSLYGMSQAGRGLRGVFGDRDAVFNIEDAREKYMRDKGFIPDEFHGEFKKATHQSALDMALSENFSSLERKKIEKMGFDTFDSKFRADFEKWSGVKGILNPGFLQRENVTAKTGGPPMGGLDFAIDKLTEYLKHAGFEVEKFAKKVQSSRNEVSESPAYTDRYMSYKRGKDMIENRGELFDKQAIRNMSPSDVQMWNSQTYHDMMKKAVDGFPQGDMFPEIMFSSQYGGDTSKFFEERRRWETSGDTLTKDVRDKDAVYGKYGDAAKDFFKAAQNERRTGQLAQLLPMLSGMDPASAKKALTNIYGGDLRLDDKGIDYLRNTDMSRFFSVKPYDKLGDRPQFSTVGSVEGYNSMIETISPEVEELQVIGDAVRILNENISGNSEEERRGFEDLFQNYVAKHLSTIADNTSKMVGNVPLSTEQPDYDNP